MAVGGLGGLAAARAAGVVALLACLCACKATSALRVPPIGPRNIRGVAQQQPEGLLLGSDQPLVERCQERCVRDDRVSDAQADHTCLASAGYRCRHLLPP